MAMASMETYLKAMASMETYLKAELNAANAEIERLRAALQYIADNPVSEYVADYAREALMGRT